MKAIVKNIEYDTDGEIIDLPKQLEIEIPNHIIDEEEIEDYVSEEISNITGFSHKGFEMSLS
jgi:hypothetical protein